MRVALTRDQILGGCKLETRTVHIERLGGDVILREWSGVERDQWDDYATRATKSGTSACYLAHAACLSIVDESGKLMFSTGDAKALNEALPTRVLEDIWGVISEMNALTKKDKEQVEKNSSTGQSDNSGSS